MNYNELYNCSSVLRVVPVTDVADVPSLPDDRNFEIVYAAIEVFNDGHVHDVVVYRKTNPEYDPRNKRNPAFAHITETVTVLQTIPWAKARSNPIA